PESKRLVYWMPTLFISGFILSIAAFVFGFILPILVYVLYFSLAFILSLGTTKNLFVAILSVFAIMVQFTAYGMAFLRSTITINWLNKTPEKVYPKLFFNEN
ncbi:MAG: glycosyl transferase family 2, partial [Psychroserpens sp.]|nr:glycosyl transferase family 2 [Psychroserpens sp.]